MAATCDGCRGCHLSPSCGNEWQKPLYDGRSGEGDFTKWVPMEAYHEVTGRGTSTPILAGVWDSSPQEFTLGEITTNADGASLSEQCDCEW